jgi:hypothetical protein
VRRVDVQTVGLLMLRRVQEERLRALKRETQKNSGYYMHHLL